MDLTATWTMTLRVEIGPGARVGQTFTGVTTVIPIIGGEVRGEGWQGRILAGGADWNTALPGDLTEFSARYQFVTDDGLVVSVFNEGVTSSHLDQTVIKTRTTFLVDGTSSLAALAHGIHVATLDVAQIDQGFVVIGVYRLP